MGQGGYFVLVNGTPYIWQRTYQHSYQMETWDFPTTIAAGQTVSVYVEWDQDPPTNQKDDGGEATYTLAGTSYHFQLQARAKGIGDFYLKVYLDGITTQNNATGTTLELGWAHDGFVNFILSGKEGHFCSTNPPVNWMQNNMSTLGSQKLRYICIPGSHDAGMSKLGDRTAFAIDCNTLTQTNPIASQLQLGSRYFDIRPIISGGNYYAGHYSFLDVTWQGGNGQSLDEMITQINGFTANNRELIILDLSHDLNTDLGNDAYAAFTQAEWDKLLTRMRDTLQCLYIAPNPTAVDLTNLTLNDYLASGPAVVVVIRQSSPTVSIDKWNTSGFYRSAQLSAYNQYANTNDGQKMYTDQLNKLSAQRTSPDSQYFLLSWTLTQDAGQAVGCGAGAPSIRNLANTANPNLYRLVMNNCTTFRYPNVLYIDNITRSDPAAMAMAINNLVHGT